MADQAAEQVVTDNQTPTGIVDAAPVVEQDLITKVTNFKKPVVDASSSDTYKDFEDILDPKAKEIAITRDKQRQADYTRKTQDLAQQRKDLESKLQNMSRWSPERIQQELLSNPDFLQAAKELEVAQNPSNSGLTDQEFSALTDIEKKDFASLKSQVNELKQSNLHNSVRAEIAQTDAHLQSKYADYNPNEINSATNTLGQMSLSSVREYVYKAQLHDDHVKAAYELGRKEALQLNKDRLGAITSDGVNANANDSSPTKNKGESDTAFFVRIAQARLAQQRKK